MTPEAIEFIEAKLREDLSPEQISAVMAGAGLDRVSHERIYRRIYEDQVSVGVLRFDNGREFTGHLAVAAALDCRTYFAKGMDLRGVSAGQLELAMNRLNHRPRKVLGFKTPAAVSSGGT